MLGGVLAAKFQALILHRDERQRRLLVGAEAGSEGYVRFWLGVKRPGSDSVRTCADHPLSQRLPRVRRPAGAVAA